MEGALPAWRQLLAALGTTACVVGAAPAPAPSAAGDVKMRLVSSGAVEKLGGYTPQEAGLTNRKPAAVRKAPKTGAALYGQIRFGGRQYLVALDEGEGENARLYVDANGNGDLTDDPVPAWEKTTAPGPDGEPMTRYAGTFQLPLVLSGAAGAAPAQQASSPKGAAAGLAREGERVTLHAFRIERHDPRGRKLNGPLKYYADYAYEGEVRLGGKPYRAMLTDRATGRFTGRGPQGTASLLFLDTNGDGGFTPPGEMFETSEAVNVAGTAYTIVFPGDDGAPLKFVASGAKSPEHPRRPGGREEVTPDGRPRR